MIMRTRQKHLIILVTLLASMLGWNSAVWAAYSDAPTISTTGSAAYTPIATAINGWKNAWTPPTSTSSTTSAFYNRSTIIDQVEATILAAGKGTITDNEYDVLADALCFWLSKVSKEGLLPADGGIYGNNRGGWYINSIDLGTEGAFFGKTTSTGPDYNNSQCVWELVNTDVLISQAGPMLGTDTRLVLFTQKDHSRIYRSTNANHRPGNVMFSTNGVNSKLLILGRKNNTIQIDGGQGWSDPTSYEEVRTRTSTTSTGAEVVVKDGALLTAYTTFENNSSSFANAKYRMYATPDADSVFCPNGRYAGTGFLFAKKTVIMRD